MLFEVEGRLRFRKPVDDIRDDVLGIVRANMELLVKGAPSREEAAELKEVRVEGDSVIFVIESGRKVRAHDVFLRFARVLSEELGRRHKIGLRELEVLRCVVRIQSDSPGRDAGRLAGLPCKVEVGEEEVILRLEGLREGDVRRRLIDRLVADVERMLAGKTAAGEGGVVRTSGPKEHPFREDPFKLAKEMGWVKDFPGRGQWIYGPQYADLLMVIEELIVERVARPLGFREVLLPKLIPLEVMMRMPGYLDGVPEGMYYVCYPPRDPEAFAEFRQRVRLKKEIDFQALKSTVRGPAYVLAPAQCEPFYQQFSGQTVRLEDLPVKQFDRSGWTYRWEGGGVEGLLRVQEFRRIEFVMLGSPGDVSRLRDEVLEKGIELADELGMEWRVRVATPFYMREGEGEEGVATYDLEVLLPYSGEWLEIGSYNVHRDKFAKSFRIKEAKDREVWTGCCGFGTNRWVLGFLAQHGMEKEWWPEIVRERMRW